MKTYKSAKGFGVYYIISSMLLFDVLLGLLIYITNSYIILSILKISIIIVSIYAIYYIIHSLSINYLIDDDKIYISSIFGLKKVAMPIKSIIGYKKSTGKIKGIRLSGFVKDSFAFGRSVIDKIGNTSMYVTRNKNVLYLKTDEMCFAISPNNVDDFEKNLNLIGIKQTDWNVVQKKSVHVYKDKKFFIPFLIDSIITVIIILNPFILYLLNKLQKQMPLNFDASFQPVQWGTGKQFAFNQMIYGVLNMAIIFCIYYASYFYSKYDNKNAHKLIYISLVFSICFLLFQIVTLSVNI
ncbi:MAG: PH domain-containing protein [Bacillota bacterium]|nr:PH domain-containing protein [Bacillota bacterium]